MSGHHCSGPVPAVSLSVKQAFRGFATEPIRWWSGFNNRVSVRGAQPFIADQISCAGAMTLVGHDQLAGAVTTSSQGMQSKWSCMLKLDSGAGCGSIGSDECWRTGGAGSPRSKKRCHAIVKLFSSRSTRFPRLPVSEQRRSRKFSPRPTAPLPPWEPDGTGRLVGRTSRPMMGVAVLTSRLVHSTRVTTPLVLPVAFVPTQKRRQTGGMPSLIVR